MSEKRYIINAHDHFFGGQSREDIISDWGVDPEDPETKWLYHPWYDVNYPVRPAWYKRLYWFVKRGFKGRDKSWKTSASTPKES